MKIINFIFMDKLMNALMFRKMAQISRLSIKVLRKDGLLKNAVIVLKRDGMGEVVRRIKLLINPILKSGEDLAIDIYCRQQRDLSLDEMKLQIEGFSRQPLISIIMPVYNTPPKWLCFAIESLSKQVYDNWELCAVDDCSSNINTQEILAKYAQLDSRVKVRFSEMNSGISKASNISMQMAKGEYIALLDHDDELTPDALFWVVKEINEHPNTDFIYTDECKIDDTEKRKLFDFIFKPDWSPEMLFNGMYTGHLTVYRKTLIAALGGFRSEYDFSQDYDLALRATEITGNIRHIERVLYFWRAIDGSAARGDKNFARVSNLDVLKDAFKRRKIQAQIIAKPFSHYPKIIIKEKEKVSIIIPTDSFENLKRSIDSLLITTAYDNYEIVVVCNSGLASEMQLEYVYFKNIFFSCYDKTFNFSDKCNQGVKDSTGNILVFYNDDVIPQDSSWLDNLIEYLYIPGVGGVSPKLIFENNGIQYAGMISGMPGFVGTAYCGYGKDESDAFLSMHHYVRNVSILSGACLAVKKTVFNFIGGFDALNTPNGHSDIDLSYRILETGLRCVYTPHAILTHIGNRTWYPKKLNKDKLDIYLLKKWGRYLNRDPYFTDSMKAVLCRHLTYKFKIYAKTVDSKKEYKGKDILLISHELNQTGAPRALLYAAIGLKKAGHFPVVIAPQDGEILKDFENEGIAVIVDEMLYKNNLLTEHFMKNFDLMVVNTQISFPVIEQMKGYKIPIIWWLHEAACLKNMVQEIESALDICDKIILASNYAKSYLNLNSKKVAVLQYGTGDIAPTKVEDKSGNISTKIKFCVVGTVDPIKGQDVFVDAILRLPDEIRLKAEFYIIGEVYPHWMPFYNKLMKKTELIAEIKYCSALPHREVIRYIESCDVLVCPSMDEATSLVTIEAMMCGKAVIVSSNIGVGEKLEHEISCLRFTMENAQELSEKMKYFINQPEKIVIFGNEARKVYEKEFALEKFEKNFLHVMQEFLEK